MKERLKISFIGDIMCEKPLLKAAHRRNGEYDFGDLFQNTQEFLSKSDYVVGNLETVCAGEKAGYTHEIYSFNTPDSFLDALESSGINLVSLANNHCLDRGVEGAITTIHKLNARNIEHMGFNPDGNVRFIREICGTKIAFLCATYGTNTTTNGVLLSESQLDMLRLMRGQQDNLYRTAQPKVNALRSALLWFPKAVFSKEAKMRIKRIMGMEYNRSKVDDLLNEAMIKPYLDRIAEDIFLVKKQADLVIYYPHVGGQFNAVPGKFSRYIMRVLAQEGVDLIIGSHPHVVQEMEWFSISGKTIPCVYSLGNYSLSLSSVYVLYENLPEYGIIFHAYIAEKKIIKLTFSITKILEKKDKRLTVVLVNDLIRQLGQTAREQLIIDCTKIYNRVLKKQEVKIEMMEEYEVAWPKPS